MCLTHAKDCCWNTICTVAGRLVVVAFLSMKINLELCWTSLSHPFLPLISSLRSFCFSSSVFLFPCCLFVFLFISHSLSLSLHLFLSWPVLYMDATNEKPRGVWLRKNTCLLRSEHTHPEHQHTTPHHKHTHHTTPTRHMHQHNTTHHAFALCIHTEHEMKASSNPQCHPKIPVLIELT